MSADERATLLREGKCFKCKLPGHLSRDCPDRKQPRTTTTVAATAAQLDTLEEPNTENENTGKDRA